MKKFFCGRMFAIFLSAVMIFSTWNISALAESGAGADQTGLKRGEERLSQQELNDLLEKIVRFAPYQEEASDQMRLNNKNLKLNIGAEFQLQLLDKEGRAATDVIWIAVTRTPYTRIYLGGDNHIFAEDNVFYLSEDGKVTAIKPGNFQVWAKHGDYLYRGTVNILSEGEQRVIEMNRQVDEKVEEIVKDWQHLENDLDKILLAHDYLIEHMSYAGSPFAQYPEYDALISGQGVCYGYARAFNRLMGAMNIESVVEVGNGNNIKHAWNKVRIGDRWYFMDLTWDDQPEKENRYRYFMMDEATLIGSGHERIAAQADRAVIGGKEYMYYPHTKRGIFASTDEEIENVVARHLDASTKTLYSGKLYIPNPSGSNREAFLRETIQRILDKNYTGASVVTVKKAVSMDEYALYEYSVQGLTPPESAGSFTVETANAQEQTTHRLYLRVDQEIPTLEAHNILIEGATVSGLKRIEKEVKSAEPASSPDESANANDEASASGEGPTSGKADREHGEERLAEEKTDTERTATEAPTELSPREPANTSSEQSTSSALAEDRSEMKEGSIYELSIKDILVKDGEPIRIEVQKRGLSFSDPTKFVSVRIVKEEMPTAEFEATDFGNGMLSTSSENVKYSVGDGRWHALVNGQPVLISPIYQKPILVIRESSSAEILRSDMNKIVLEYQEQPSWVISQDATVGGSDGKLLNVTEQFQYKGVDQEEWLDVPAGQKEVRGLSGGIYQVRLKPSGTRMASQEYEVTVREIGEPKPASAPIDSPVRNDQPKMPDINTHAAGEKSKAPSVENQKPSADSKAPDTNMQVPSVNNPASGENTQVSGTNAQSASPVSTAQPKPALSFGGGGGGGGGGASTVSNSAALKPAEVPPTQTQTQTTTQTTESVSTILTIGQTSYTVFVGGQSVQKTMDVAPQIHHGRTVLPTRMISELLGVEVAYDPATKTASFRCGDGNIVTLAQGQPYMLVNGQKTKLSAEIVTVKGRMLLPLSDIQRAFEELGLKANVGWDPKKKSVTIDREQA